ncbi:hypothetical protein [Acinetobacter sp.]|uniref:hypothetical protein n=1 Tax=Acinetobacter sp. TaxID=472 RepID=UPI0035AECD92
MKWNAYILPIQHQRLHVRLCKRKISRFCQQLRCTCLFIDDIRQGEQNRIFSLLCNFKANPLKLEEQLGKTFRIPPVLSEENTKNKSYH